MPGHVCAHLAIIQTLNAIFVCSKFSIRSLLVVLVALSLASAAIVCTASADTTSSRPVLLLLLLLLLVVIYWTPPSSAATPAMPSCAITHERNVQWKDEP